MEISVSWRTQKRDPIIKLDGQFLLMSTHHCDLFCMCEINSYTMWYRWNRPPLFRTKLCNALNSSTFGVMTHNFLQFESDKPNHFMNIHEKKMLVIAALFSFILFLLNEYAFRTFMRKRGLSSSFHATNSKEQKKFTFNIFHQKKLRTISYGYRWWHHHFEKHNSQWWFVRNSVLAKLLNRLRYAFIESEQVMHFIHIVEVEAVETIQ